MTKTHTHTHTHTFNGPFSRTTRVSRYQKGKPVWILLKQEWQWHQLGHMQVCTSLQTDNHHNTSPLSFLQAGCPSCRPTNSAKALKALKYPLEDETNFGQRYFPDVTVAVNLFNTFSIIYTSCTICLPIYRCMFHNKWWHLMLRCFNAVG